MQSLAPGRRLGPYEIVAPLGAGGMGEVYRARDTRLNRDVAIKVLPEGLTSDPDRRARFQREAEAVAALSHPNILAIFDTGIDPTNQMSFVVTELLEGETLRDRLASGALAPRKAVEFAIQIARGLAAAHEKGIVHRDIKPENIFILKDGQVKILDFGLARPVAAGSGATATVAAMTDPGSVMGTVGYMAPEQVRAQPLDARTDLFALGAVFYEMLTGQRAFHRETAAETMTAILREDPPELRLAKADLSPAFDRVVRHCLEKNPAERFQTARDVAFALESLTGSSTATGTNLPAAPAEQSSWVRSALWAASIVAAAALGTWASRLLGPAESHIQFDTKTFDRQSIFNARFMPDGQTIVYSAVRQDGVSELFILHPDSVAPQTIGGPGTHLLAVSSKGELAVLTDSEYIAHRLFQGTLARMSPGGSPRQVMEGVREADWSPDGNSLAIVRDLRFGPGGTANRDRLEFPVGTALYEADGYLSDPRVSRDGTKVAFVEHRFRYDDRGFVKVVDTAKHVVTLTGEFWGLEGLSWTDEGTQLVFSGSEGTRPGGLSYEPFAVNPSEPGKARPAFPVMTNIVVTDVSRSGQWLLSRDELRDGITIKKPGETAERDYSWLDHSSAPVLSADGSLMAFTDENAGAGPAYAVMVRKTDGSPAIRLGEGGLVARGLSPDSKWVAARVPSKNQIVFYPTGPGDARRPDLRADQFNFAGWFKDSQHVLMCGGPTQPGRCWKYATAGGEPVPVGPEIVLGAGVGLDDAIVAIDGGGKAWFYPADGAPRTSFKLPAGEPVGPAAGGGAFIAINQPNHDVHVDRVNFITGAKEPVADIIAPRGIGLLNLFVTSAIGGPGHYGYAYQYSTQLSTLVVASGISVH